MTPRIQAFAEAVKDFSAAEIRSALWRFLRTFIATYGYNRLSVFQQPQTFGIGATQVLYSDLDGSILDRLKRFGWRHPIILQALRADEPFAVSELDLDAVDPDPALREVELYPGEGLVLPMGKGESARCVAVLAGDVPDLSPVARSLLNVATETAVNRAQVLPADPLIAPGAALLSQREIAILKSAAAGKPDAEIGRELHISARTVRFHTDNAKRKLRATSRIKAVTEALRLGLIKL